MIQDYIYYILILICLAVSIYNKTARQNCFWIYFLAVIFYELFFKIKIINLKIYSTSAIFYSLFFLNVYLNELKKKEYSINIIKYIFSILIFGLGVLLMFEKSGYSINLGLIMTFTYISNSLVWFFTEFKRDSYIRIIDRQFFWISTSLLFWAIFFLFRLIPMYLFMEIDNEFLMLLNEVFQIVTIISYVVFFIGLLCKE